MRHYYPAVFEPADEGGFVVTVPDIEGCFTEGANLDEAMMMTFDAIGCVLNETAESDYPKASRISDINLSEYAADSFVTLVMFDRNIYERGTDTLYNNDSDYLPARL